MKGFMKKILFAVALSASVSVAFADDTNKPQPVAEKDTYALHTPKTACFYEGKAYSEGALYGVGNTTLICVKPNWGIIVHSDANLVWEPINSPRLEQNRKATSPK